MRKQPTEGNPWQQVRVGEFDYEVVSAYDRLHNLEATSKHEDRTYHHQGGESETAAETGLLPWEWRRSTVQDALRLQSGGGRAGASRAGHPRLADWCGVPGRRAGRVADRVDGAIAGYRELALPAALPEGVNWLAGQADGPHEAGVVYAQMRDYDARTLATY